MQAPWRSRDFEVLLDNQPTVGGLVALCEENYAQLLRLVPRLLKVSGQYRSVLPDHPDLLLQVLEHTRYTSCIRLTHCFPEDSDPDLLLRVYHDAHQVEVLELKQQSLPLWADYQAPALRNKWRLNLFLSKWLGYCLALGHGFDGRSRRTLAEPALAD